MPAPAGFDSFASQRYWLKIGLDAYQIFAFFKAAKAKVRPDGACFLAGTNVITGINTDGSYRLKPIEEIGKGDLVLSRDQDDVADDLDLRVVNQVFRKTSDHIRTLTIQDAGGNIETIQTTDEHPFWIVGRGWVGAGGVKVGERVGEADGSNDAIVLATHRTEHPAGITVYNLEIEADHTYFVADVDTSFTNPVWVHNATGGVCPIFNQPRPVRDMPGQILGKPHRPATTLKENLKKAGVPFVDGASPHHIVPGGSLAGARGKAVLEKHNIDINQADNGVYLTAAGRQASPPTIYHGETFSHAKYGEAVSKRIEKADETGDREGVLDELARIREDLLSGKKFW